MMISPLKKSPGHVLSRSGRNIQVFSMKDLKSATRNFHMMNCIGRGGFGPVYKVDHCTCFMHRIAAFLFSMLYVITALLVILYWQCSLLFRRVNDNGSPSLRET